MLFAVVLTDAGYFATYDPFWARMSLFLLAAGQLFAHGAAAVGMIDFLTSQRVRNLTVAWAHMIGNGAQRHGTLAY
jgi:uncharacterized membrane protein